MADLQDQLREHTAHAARLEGFLLEARNESASIAAVSAEREASHKAESQALRSKLEAEKAAEMRKVEDERARAVEAALAAHRDENTAALVREHGSCLGKNFGKF